MSKPNVRDIGAFTEPVLVFGGVYGNLQAFEALVAAAAKLQIPPERMIHTGDVAAYCADAFACASALRDLGCHVIRGNVEEQLAQSADDCACGFAAGSECDLLAARWYALASSQTTPQLRRWMRAMPDHLRFTMQGRRFLIVHGSPRRTNQFVFPSFSDSFFDPLFDDGADCIVAGHSGLPFTRVVGNRIWHNSGALGLPANDATTRVWFSIVAPLGPDVEFSFRAIEYDHATAAGKMRQAGLPGSYADALSSGLWPSTDILPATEAGATGSAIAPASHRWPALQAAAE